MKWIAFVERISIGLHLFSGIIISVMMFVIVYDVVMRFIFNSPTGWALEIAEYMLATVIFFSLSYVLSRGMHIHVDLIVSRLSRTKQAILGLIVSFIALIFFSLLTWESSIAAWEAYQLKFFSAGSPPLPLFPVRTVVPLGCFLLSLRLIIEIGYHLRSLLDRGKA